MSILIVMYLFVLGLIFGSFVNAWVWRLRQQLDDDGEPIKLSKKKHRELSITRGRSMCPQCKHGLATKDLVPVFSWLWLKGKCRYCRAPISKQYPIIELSTGAFFAASYLLWPVELASYEWIVFIGWLLALVPLIAMAIYDAKWYVLPSRLIYVATGSYGASLLLYASASGNWHAVWQALLAAVVYCGLFLGIFLASYVANKQGWSSKDWLGFGDVRLAFLLGLLAGTVLSVFVAIFLASIGGLLYALPSMVSKKSSLTTQIPFGPFLIIGAALALFIGSSLINWYTTVILGI